MPNTDTDQRKAPERPEKWLRIKDVAELLGVSQSWVRSHVTKQRPLLPHIRINGVVRFRMSEIETFLDRYKVRDEAA